MDVSRLILRSATTLLLSAVALIINITVAHAVVNGTPSDGTVLGEVKATNLVSPCSGTLLTNHWVLTARHCKPTDIFDGVRTYQLAELIRHPDLDVGLARLATPMSIAGSTEGYIRPLSWMAFRDFKGRKVRCGGWGNYKAYDRGISDVFRTAVLPVPTSSFPRDEPWEVRVFRNERDQSMAEGDSGSSCFKLDGNAFHDYHRVLGIFSGGSHAGDGRYTDHQHIRSWVTEATTTRQIQTSNGGCVTGHGSFARVEPCQADEPSQLWRVVGRNSDSRVSFRNMAIPNDPYCLSAPDSVLHWPEEPGQQLILKNCSRSDATQFWTIDGISTKIGQSLLRMEVSGKATCISERGQQELVTSPCSVESTSSHFTFRNEHVAYPIFKNKVKQWFRFDDGRCLSVPDGTGAPILSACDYLDEHQAWVVTQRDWWNADVEIRSAFNGLCLTFPTYAGNPVFLHQSIPILLWYCNDGNQLQSWRLGVSSQTMGTVHVQASVSRQSLPMCIGNSSYYGSNAEIAQWNCNGWLTGTTIDYGRSSALAISIRNGEVHPLMETNLDIRPELDVNVLDEKKLSFTIYDQLGNIVIFGNLVSNFAQTTDGRLKIGYRIGDWIALDPDFKIVRVIVDGFEGRETEVGYTSDLQYGYLQYEIGPTTVRRTRDQFLFDFNDSPLMSMQNSVTIFTITEATAIQRYGIMHVVAENSETGELAATSLRGAFAPKR